MAFESQWLNWRKDGDQTGNAIRESSVSSVSSSERENHPKGGSKEEEEEVLKLHTSDKTTKTCVQGTDGTDRTPTEKRSLDGHQVIRVIWETDKAAIFADDHGRFWRYLFARGKAWPVIVEGGR